MCSLRPDYVKIQKYCNIGRNFNDIDDSWTSVKSTIDFYNKNQDILVSVSKPGVVNDLDMVWDVWFSPIKQEQLFRAFKVSIQLPISIQVQCQQQNILT